tara:strand:+ start:852 stop:1076 length:225 start_codon:yes stop_codon:yes gene_type:complete
VRDGTRIALNGRIPKWGVEARYDEGPRLKWMCIEKKSERKIYQRSYRARVREAMHREQWEDIPQWRKTSGWLTW